MNNNIYVNGIELPDGIPTAPSFTFLNDLSTGLFLNHTNTNVKSLGVAMSGKPIALFGSTQIELLKNLKFASGSADQSLLVSDASGIASWKVGNANGFFKWNSLFAGLDFTQNAYVNNITFPQTFAQPPSVILSKESNALIADNFDLYAKNKTTMGYTAYSNFTMFKTLLNDVLGDYTTLRLGNGGLGIVYYSITSGKIMYVTTDANYGAISAPLVIDTAAATGLCSACLVGGIPALVYVAFNTLANKYEWRYVLANDAVGLSFKNPVVVYSTTTNITGLPLSLIIIFTTVPTIFLNTETGAAQVFKAQDSAGQQFNNGVAISNLVSHQILRVQIVNGLPAVLARSTTGLIYYVQATSTDGTQWPIAATQLFKANNTSLLSNVNKYSTTMGLVNNVLTIIASEIGSNSLYSAAANDINGASFTSFSLLITNNTPTPFTTIFQSNTTSYIMYNNVSGTPSKKNIIQFASDGTIALATDGFINTLNGCGDNQSIANVRDGNSVILLNTASKLILIRFFGNDFNINWSAIA